MTDKEFEFRTALIRIDTNLVYISNSVKLLDSSLKKDELIHQLKHLWEQVPEELAFFRKIEEQKDGN